MIGQDVLLDPSFSSGKLSQRRYVAVSDRNGNGNPRSGEGFKDVGIRVEYLNPVDVCFAFEEFCYLCRSWEIVGDGSVVDADGIDGGGSGGENRKVATKEEED